MGRRGKYANLKPRRNIRVQETIISALGILALLAYLYWGKRILARIQWDMFGNSRTLLFMSPSIILSFLELLSGPAFIMSTLFFVYYSIRQRQLSRIYGKPVHRYSKDLKGLGMAAAVSFVIIVLSFFSYCRADSDGLFVRDIGTLFREKPYTWDSVESVEITYHQNTRGGDYAIGYFINFDRFSINVQEASQPPSGDLLDRSGKAIHRLVRSNGIPVSKDIDRDDREIRQYLDDIGER